MNAARRDFLKSLTLTLSLGAGALATCRAAEPRFKISLAQWSMHKALRAGELDPLDWPKHTRENFDLNALEYSNHFFSEEHETFGFQPKNEAYLKEMKRRAEDHGMTNLLIMCDRVGQIGDPDDDKRGKAVQGHYAWCDAAKLLGCHSIRVNAASDPKLPGEEQAELCADGLWRLAMHAQAYGLNVIVENHGGLSSDGAWLAGVMRAVGLDNCGTLPDFGNFYLARNRGDAAQYEAAKAPFAGGNYEEDETGLQYNRYRGIEDLMPFAKGVSAKSHDFDAAGNETRTDFFKAIRLVKDSGYQGYIGIEYEGDKLPEVEGIRATRQLLERVFAELGA